MPPDSGRTSWFYKRGSNKTKQISNAIIFQIVRMEAEEEGFVEVLDSKTKCGTKSLSLGLSDGRQRKRRRRGWIVHPFAASTQPWGFREAVATSPACCPCSCMACYHGICHLDPSQYLGGCPCSCLACHRGICHLDPSRYLGLHEDKAYWQSQQWIHVFYVIVASILWSFTSTEVFIY